MNAAPTSLLWLIRDTFRQALASGVFWFMLAVTALCVLVCLTAHFQQPATEGETVQLRLAFGLVQTPGEKNEATAVRVLQLVLVGGVADTAGLLLALIWTAGFLPAFLEPDAVSILLAKPVSRWALLVGKVVGVLAVVAVPIVLFIAGTWLALGLRTGVWEPACFLAIPLLLLHFAIFFSFSTMLAVALRSTVVCIVGGLLFWITCLAMNFGRHAVALLPDMQKATPGLWLPIDLAYWLLPKPLDFHFLLQSLLQVDSQLFPVVDLAALDDAGAWRPIFSMLTSGTFAVVFLLLALYDFMTADY